MNKVKRFEVWKSFKLKKEELEILKERSYELGISAAEFVRQAIRAYKPVTVN